MISLLKDNPCYNCTDRTVSCHAECMLYINWKSKIDAYNAKVKKEKQAEYAAFIVDNTRRER